MRSSSARGQAGVAMSEHLSSYGVPTSSSSATASPTLAFGRWDSLVANGPAWHDRFPGWSSPSRSGRLRRRRSGRRLLRRLCREDRARRSAAGSRSPRSQRNAGRPGFRVETSAGVIEAEYVVAATGPFQRPVIPAIVPEDAGVGRSTRRLSQPRPAARGRGAGRRRRVLGRADRRRAARAGRRVYLSVGPHDRPPRAYRGRDFVWWLGVLEQWDPRRRRPARARHHRRQRRPWRPHRRLPPARRAGHDAGRPDRSRSRTV